LLLTNPRLQLINLAHQRLESSPISGSFEVCAESSGIRVQQFGGATARFDASLEIVQIRVDARHPLFQVHPRRPHVQHTPFRVGLIGDIRDLLS
jgi:hypothetical protein